jgi:GMP synthase-like glutamine amidotransferase
MNVYEEDRYPFLRKEDLFIKESIQRGRNLLGICLGAQLIAKALGAKVFRSPVKEIGWYDMVLTEEGSRDHLFSHFPETFPVFQWHKDTFDIPKAGKLIATSNPVLHQAFRYGENAYGLQFHLEVPGEMIQEWMETYEEEFRGSSPNSFSKVEILSKTEMAVAAYTKMGISFLTKFFK